MSYTQQFTPEAREQYEQLKAAAEKARATRASKGKAKSSRQEGTYKQVHKALGLLAGNPRHPSLNTHPFTSMPHPWDEKASVFEAYAQNKTPGAYRIFWCNGPGSGEISVIAITPHP